MDPKVVVGTQNTTNELRAKYHIQSGLDCWTIQMLNHFPIVANPKSTPNGTFT